VPRHTLPWSRQPAEARSQPLWKRPTTVSTDLAVSVTWQIPHQSPLKLNRLCDFQATPCGVCGACSAQPPRRSESPHGVRLYAIDLLGSNAKLVRHLLAVHGMNGTVIHAAAGNQTGTAWTATFKGRTGNEGASAKLQEQRGNTVPIPMVTVDSFSAARELQEIDLLSIDVEGWDALVIEGAETLLRERRIHMLEFEYSNQGKWSVCLGCNPGTLLQRRSLRSTLRLLWRYGFTCLWQGDHGLLAPANGPAWCGAFDFRLRSNLICTHLEHVLSAWKPLLANSTSVAEAGQAVPYQRAFCTHGEWWTWFADCRAKKARGEESGIALVSNP